MASKQDGQTVISLTEGALYCNALSALTTCTKMIDDNCVLVKRSNYQDMGCTRSMNSRKNDVIKIATSAGRDVLLYPNGTVQCGRVTYRSRKHAQEFKDIYTYINHYLRRHRITKRDVSGPIRTLTIEDLAGYMEEKWQATITVGRVQRLAAEATVRRLVAERIFPVFMDYVNGKWRREFPKMSDEEKRRHPTADKLY